MSDRGASDFAGFVHAHWRAIMMVIVAALGAGVLAALIVTVGYANTARDRALTLQSQSFDVMLRARGLAETMARAEASLGRYVISGDQRIGVQYQDEWVRAGQQIDRLDLLVRDNQEQDRRIDALRIAYTDRGAELALIALSTRYKKNNQALAHYYAARDAASLRRITRLLESFITREKALLQARSDAAQTTIAASNLAAKVLALFGIAIVLGAIALGWLTLRAQTARAVADAETEAERQRVELLEAAVHTVTTELQTEAREREVAEAKLRQMQKLDAVGQLTGGIAHDFNNMLAVVLGGIELAKRHHGGRDPEVSRHLDSAEEGAERAAALTRRLLAFARVEPLQPASVEAAGVIAGMSDLIDRTLGDAITIETHDRSEGWRVRVDPSGLENAVLNLAVNARDAMDGRGTLRIATGAARLAEHEVDQCAAGDYATIAVADSGCGMSAEVMERVFEPFFTTKPIGKGTGLGLSQIFGFVRQSGGAITIDSIAGQGTTVTIYLPRDTSVASAPARLPTRPEPVTPRAAPSPRRILVVEDDPRVLSATIDALKDLGHAPVPCGDPFSAATMVAEHGPFDLILSDVLMPGKTGPELIAELRPALPGVAVLFVTGFAGDAAEHTGFEDYPVLRKPYTIAALEAAVAAAVDAPPGGEPVRSAA
ncbi:ATP-binding protein [Sphingomonas sp.]|uniref:ATP-binding protein n=1 Tax=Sphingomonas sp. TaxID=28214 RepID=UPI002DD6252E|nr:ATP-binding protein [Sphingomonas sp.]